eukprot:1613896-Pyramimonas_sp.AAC.1
MAAAVILYRRAPPGREGGVGHSECKEEGRDTSAMLDMRARRGLERGSRGTLAHVAVLQHFHVSLFQRLSARKEVR